MEIRMSSPRVLATDTTSHSRQRAQAQVHREETEPLNPGWLRTFMEVYRTGSFGGAARKLHISQPAVTHQIRLLEERVGTRLFVRQATGSKPTPAADSLAHDAEGPVDALNFVLQRYSSSGGPPGRIRIGAPGDLISDRILPVLADLLLDSVQLRTTPALSDALLSQLTAGELDIVVARTRPRVTGISALPLYDEEWSLVAHPDVARTIPEKHLARKAPQILGGRHLIACAESLPLIDHYWWSVFHAEVPAAPDVVVPDQRAVLAAVKASVGIAVLPTYLCADDVAQGALVPLVRPEVPPITTTYLATREGDVTRSQMSAAHSRLLEHGRRWT
ncbi:LysR family transcriptional regulator [Kitasatospora sp. NPDC059722]|uniref:LysR family transcriptional regulator n=1 Tax=unclassified Kitasatospora TaxID=2633591 RepID=UPI00364CBC6B